MNRRYYLYRMLVVRLFCNEVCCFLVLQDVLIAALLACILFMHHLTAQAIGRLLLLISSWAKQIRDKGRLAVGLVLNVLIEARQEKDVGSEHGHGQVQIAEELVAVAMLLTSAWNELHQVGHFGVKDAFVGVVGGRSPLLLLLSQLDHGLRPHDQAHSLTWLD